ncbi:MAG: hypothetical protein U0354_16735 [Candidatus Sericytochromatia bacterium]
MTNKNSLLKVLLGSAVIGAGYYFSKNKDLQKQVNSKLKESLDNFYTNTADLQEKLNEKVKVAKETFNKTIEETKSSLNDTKTSVNDNVSKTSEQVQNLIKRLSNAYTAGREAAKESMKKQDFVHETVKENLSQESSPNLGATEDNSPLNTNELHPSTSNVSRSIGDAGYNFDKISSKSDI